MCGRAEELAGGHRAVERTHDAGRDGALQAQRGADGHDGLADLEGLRVADLDGREAAGDLDDGDVAIGIAADHRTGPALARRAADENRRGLFDHVVVGEDVRPPV